MNFLLLTLLLQATASGAVPLSENANTEANVEFALVSINTIVFIQPDFVFKIYCTDQLHLEKYSLKTGLGDYLLLALSFSLQKRNVRTRYWF